MSFLHAAAAVIGIAALGVAAGYSVMTLLALAVWRFRRAPAVATARPPGDLAQAAVRR